jgi:ABC-2 type transport system ATP-binding protein
MVRRGSIFGLLGPNGAGKSTFINILAGLVKKTAGEISVWGFDIDRNPRQARASLGIVPQEINMDVFFTPLEALEIQAGLYGVPKSKRRSMEVLNALGLSDKAGAYVRMLSGGMKRRLLVAKAMVHSPPILILDEPTAGVDIELRKQLWEYVLRLHEQGVTIVLTTHYLEEAQELCKEIAIIHNGDVVACEPTEKLISSLDRKTLMVTPRDDLAAAPDLGRFDADLKADGRLAIAYQPSRTQVGEILERLAAAGVSVKDLSTVESDLEDVFLELTYRTAS